MTHSAPARSPSPGRPWGAGRIIVLVLGILAALLAVGLLVGGGALLWADRTQRDADDYLSTGAERFSSSGYAIASENIDVGRDTPTWILSERVIGLVRLRGEAADGGEVFLGLGPAGDVRDYLSGVAYDEVTDLDYEPFRATYRTFEGGAPPGPPGEQGFWTESASGSGLQTLTWEVERGDWTIVVMNADGASGVDALLSAGAEAPFLTWLAAALLAGGLLFLLAAALLIFLAVREGGAATYAAGPPGARAAAAPGGVPPAGVGRYPAALRGDLDPSVGRWLWLVKWLLAIPHYVVLWFLWIAFFVLTVVAGFAILFTGRYPRGIFDFNVGVARWTWRVAFYTYWALGTDRYPPFTLASVPDYPADYDVAYPERLSRGLVLVKWWLLAIPHYILVGIFLGGVGGGWWWGWGWGWRGDGWGGGGPGLVIVLVLFAGIALLFTSRYPRGIFEFVLGLDRWALRLLPYAALMRDEYPPFRLDQGPREPVAPARAEAVPPRTPPTEPAPEAGP